jgi:capsid protein
MNPLTLQIMNNDQIQQPYDSPTVAAIKARGAKVEEGIEYDATGHMVAIYVKEDIAKWDKPLKRIPFFGPRSGRRFVIYDANQETAEQFRGYPELAAMVYELDRLTEMSITEIENSIASALWFAAIETEVGGQKTNPIKPTGSSTTTVVDGMEDGPREVKIGKRALVMQNLGKGQKLKPVQPQHPNPNYEKFVEIHETMICSVVGIPLSAYRQKFQSSYSAARAEILFLWNNITRRRSDFAYGFLDPVFESWFSEEVAAGNINAPGFRNLPVARRAWLAGTWDGISRPVVDPVKEVNAVKTRLDLGHTTNDREAKTYNGSGFRENIKRLKTENEMRREANLPIDPDLAFDNGNTGSDQEDGNATQ